MSQQTWICMFSGWSAIEYTDNRKSERDELVKKLAENSAGFIATINKDEYDSR